MDPLFVEEFANIAWALCKCDILTVLTMDTFAYENILVTGAHGPYEAANMITSWPSLRPETTQPMLVLPV